MASQHAHSADLRGNTDAIEVQVNTTNKPGDVLIIYPSGHYVGNETFEACNFDYLIESAEVLSSEQLEVTVSEYRDGSLSVYKA